MLCPVLYIPVWAQVESSLPNILWKHGEAERLREGPQAANRLPGVYNGEDGRVKGKG